MRVDVVHGPVCRLLGELGIVVEVIRGCGGLGEQLGLLGGGSEFHLFLIIFCERKGRLIE